MLLLTRTLSKVPKVLLVTLVWLSVWGWEVVLKLRWAPKFLHMVSQKWLSVPIRNYALWNVVKTHKLLEVEISNMRGIICSMTSHKVSYLWESIHHNHDRILVSLHPRQSHGEIQANILSRALRDGKGRVKALGPWWLLVCWQIEHILTKFSMSLDIFGQWWWSLSMEHVIPPALRVKNIAFSYFWLSFWGEMDRVFPCKLNISKAKNLTTNPCIK